MSPAKSPFPAAARELLHQAGLRATPQRIAVLEALRNARGHHLSADEVWQRVGSGEAAMDRSTAYRVLASLSAAGILTQVRLADDVTRFEIQQVPHHHAVCVNCGATEDVDVDWVERLGARLHERSGFVLGNEALLLPGLCRRCAAG